MSINNQSSSEISRRDFGKQALALAAGIGLSHLALPTPSQAAENGLPSQPNLLFIITDQQRFPRHWPTGWADQHLPAWKRLRKNGITFTRFYCNSSMCSPSRATLLTGLYPEQHGVTSTITDNANFSYTNLSTDLPNMASLLTSAGYQVVYKGKWHLSRKSLTEDPSAEDLAAYGFDGWNPPEYGQDELIEHCAILHDATTVDDAISFMQEYAKSNSSQPFALFVSLANPHDLWAYPTGYDTYYTSPEIFDQGISLPDSISDDLSTKPAIQKIFLSESSKAVGTITSAEQQKKYVNFYAYLHKVIDEQIERLLTAMDTQKLTNSTVVVRTADHGEMGMSHGGMRQKSFVMYEEVLNIPLIISNPILFPTGVETDSLASLIDLVPTVSSLAKVHNMENYEFRGYDLSPILSDPTKEVQDTILFTFDDQRAGTDKLPQPNHVQAVIGKEWKYARYYDPKNSQTVVHEMYNIKSDPAEMNNLAGKGNSEESNLKTLLNTTVEERLRPLKSVSAASNWEAL